jgi:hypothetical protein
MATNKTIQIITKCAAAAGYAMVIEERIVGTRRTRSGEHQTLMDIWYVNEDGTHTVREAQPVTKGGLSEGRPRSEMTFDSARLAEVRMEALAEVREAGASMPVFKTK